MKTFALAALLTLFALPASAEPSTEQAPTTAPAGGPLLIAPKLGVFVPTSKLGSAFYGGLEVGYVTPLLDRSLAVILDGAYYQPELKGSISDSRLTTSFGTASGAYRLDERELALMLSIVYRAERAWRELTPYVGVGPSLYRHRAAMAAFGSTTIESDSSLGFQALAGAEWRIASGGPFVEARYQYSHVDFMSTGSASTGGFAFAAGYRFEL